MNEPPSEQTEKAKTSSVDEDIEAEVPRGNGTTLSHRIF